MDQIRQNFINGMKLIKEMEKIFEMWHKIEDYDNYSVSSFGRVRNDTTKKILKPSINKNNKYNYVVIVNTNGISKNVNIHRLIALAFIPNPNLKTNVDHIDGNRQNNILHNLRWATPSENNMNTKIKSNNTSGTKGVSWDKAKKKWQAIIHVNKKPIFCGYFENKEDAIIKQKQMEKEHYGEFAKI